MIKSFICAYKYFLNSLARVGGRAVLGHLEQQGTYARLLFLGIQHNICLWITDSLRAGVQLQTHTSKRTLHGLLTSQQWSERPKNDCTSWVPLQQLPRSFYCRSIENVPFHRKCANLLCAIFYEHFIFFFFTAYVGVMSVRMVHIFNLIFHWRVCIFKYG